MQILSESEYTHWMYTTGYYGVFDVIALIMLIVLILGVAIFFVSGNFDAEESLLKVALIMMIIGFIGIVTSVIIAPTTKPYTEVKATVSDWNVVHDEGWEVVEQEGEIVTLRKYEE